eukprot:UN05408
MQKGTPGGCTEWDNLLSNVSQLPFGQLTISRFEEFKRDIILVMVAVWGGT